MEGKAQEFLQSTRLADAAFAVFLSALAVLYYSSISTYKVPMWDAAVYLTNARGWLTGTPIFEIYRSPLISWIIAGVWTITGEDWQIVKSLSALFGIASAVVLYLTLKRDKKALFGLAIVALTMLSPQVFFYSTQIYTESLSLCFLLATLYLVKSERRSNWLLAGITVGLTFASRYPIILQAGALVVVESYARRNWRILVRAMVGAIPVVAAVVLIMLVKTGTFQVALPNSNNLTVFLSPYYLQNSVVTWGWIFLLVPLAFVIRATYTHRYNYVFIVWFALSMIFWSADATNVNLRFTIQFTPAVYYLALLALEPFVKTGEPFRMFLRRELIFLPKMHAMRSTE